MLLRCVSRQVTVWVGLGRVVARLRVVPSRLLSPGRLVEFGGKGQNPHPLKAEPFGQRPQDKDAAPGEKSKMPAGCRRYQSEKRREISPLREPTRSQEANAKKRRRLASVEMTVWVVGVDLSWLKPRATKRVERKSGSL